MPRPRRLWAVLGATCHTYRLTRAPTRAAALSFSTLLGLGPLIALIVILGTPLLGQRDPLIATKALDRLLHLIAPQVVEYERLNNTGAANAVASFNPRLMEILDGFVAGAHRGTAGTFGAVSLVVIVFFLFRSIEGAFNDIWGVTAQRSLFRAVAYHLILLFAGAFLFFSAATLLSIGTFINVFVEGLPIAAGLVRWFLPTAGFALVAALLTVAYRLLPAARVRWRPALVGSVAATGLLLLNNFLAFLYLRRVLMTRSLYGSLGVVPVLMIGLYVFWLIVLIGGHISFAVQKTYAPSKLGSFSP